MAQDITQAEWIAELERLWRSRPEDDGLTVQEYAEATGWPYSRAHKVVKEGVKSGQMVLGRRYVEKDWDGKARVYTVYRPAVTP